MLSRTAKYYRDNPEARKKHRKTSAKAQKNYMKKYKMPWLALINQSAPARKISSQLEVEFIPYLVVLNQDGKVLTKNGKNDVVRLGEKAFSFWQQIEEN